MKYKLNYAKLDLDGEDIPCYSFNEKQEVRNFVDGILGQHPSLFTENCVYLIGLDEQVVVTNNCALVSELFDAKLNSVYPYYEDDEMSIHEYDSYEEAYYVALRMMEDSPLCYKKEKGE